MQNAYRQILPAQEDETLAASGMRERRRMSAPIMVEYLGSPSHAAANDVASPSYLINAGAPYSTSYRFIAPRTGCRR